jgi:hypothetical protein
MAKISFTELSRGDGFATHGENFPARFVAFSACDVATAAGPARGVASAAFQYAGTLQLKASCGKYSYALKASGW